MSAALNALVGRCVTSIARLCVVAILRLRAVRRLQKLNASLGHANREAERPVGARAVHPRGGPIFVHGFLEDYAVYAVLAKKKV